MTTTITVTDVQTDPATGTVLITAQFNSDGHKWTQGFNITPSLTSYMTKPEEYVELVKTILTQHAVEVSANLDELGTEKQWEFTDAVKGLTFTIGK